MTEEADLVIKSEIIERLASRTQGEIVDSMWIADLFYHCKDCDWEWS